MPARNATLTVAKSTFTQLTDGDVTSIRIQNQSNREIAIVATAGVTPPTSTAGSIALAPGQIWAPDLTVAQLWPGITGANRVWAWSNSVTLVSVSHA